MTTTNKKPTTRKPATTNKSKANNISKNNKDTFGKTIFMNFGFNFNGTKLKSVAYLNLNNIFYNKEDTKGTYKKVQKSFSESKTYETATDILHEELEKAMKIAEKRINKKFKKSDKKLSDDEKKNISVFLSANVYDGNSKEDTNNIVF